MEARVRALRTAWRRGEEEDSEVNERVDI